MNWAQPTVLAFQRSEYLTLACTIASHYFFFSFLNFVCLFCFCLVSFFSLYILECEISSCRRNLTVQCVYCTIIKINLIQIQESLNQIESDFQFN